MERFTNRRSGNGARDGLWRAFAGIWLAVAVGCAGPAQGEPEGAGVQAVAAPAVETQTTGGIVSPAEQGLPPELRNLAERWTGDLDGMAERRVIRVLTVFAKGLYFLDGAEQRGGTYELIKMFEEEINETLDTGRLKLHVLIIPVTRDRLIPGLVEGLGDVAAANLTITSARQQLVDFSAPLLTGVNEVVVTGPAAPALTSLDDLSGREIYVRPSSSYYGSLTRLNQRFREAGRDEITLTPGDEHFEDEDLLEMVSGGLLPMVVVDSTKAEFWAQIFDDLTPRPDLAINTGGEIAWAMRKDSPLLRGAVDEFVATHRGGTLMGNILLNRYLRSTNWVRNSLAATELERFQSTLEFFQRYAGEYNFDWLMVAAQGYQESRLDQSVRSSVGAIGVMQLLPSTAADPNVGIPNIDGLEDNIHAGVKYLRFLRDRYFADPELDDLNATLLSFAAYNGGPSRIARLRREAAEAGLDPNVWFGNVENIVAKRIGRETLQYVSNIYKYYIAYRLIADTLELRGQA
jgi:membrane-bound lytic murein transglycosylase MltF